MNARFTAVAADEMRLDDNSLNQLFVQARTHNKWLNRPIDETVLRELYALTKLAPTSANSQPMRVVFVRSNEARRVCGRRSCRRTSRRP
jgi:3-hydroxypropanoate dehydrogenase